MAKFYYQFLVNSDEGRLLARYYNSCIEAEKRAQQYAKRVGAVSYIEDPNFFAGGVSYVAFQEPKKVNTDIWRFVMKDSDGTQLFEPNVRTVVGCVKARDNFVPSDVAGRIYKKKSCGWDDVRQLYTLDEWLAFIGFHTSGDKEMDTNAVVGILKDKKFFRFIDIIPMAAPAEGRRRSKDGAKAIRAEQWRIALPTVRTEDFYGIVHAETMVKNEDGEESAAKKEEPCTPVFFAYLDYWYIGLDYPIIHDGFEPITQGCFVARKNMMLRDVKNKA